MNRISAFLGLAACFAVAPAWSHSGDEVPLLVSPDGVDAGSCQDVAAPCRSIDFALGRLGKGGEIRIAAGQYTISSRDELFYILNGSIDIRGGYDKAFGQQSTEPTVLSGIPREFAEQLSQRGFHVIADNKAVDRRLFEGIRGELDRHEALKSSMPATPCVGGTANGMPCMDVDLLSHIGMADISANPSAGADVWGFVDLNTNREYAIVGFNIGTAVFDVTDAENPREVGFVDGQRTSWRDIKVYQFWNATQSRWNAQAYITTDGSTDGLFVIDLSGLPHRIQRVNYISDFSAAHNVYATNTDFGTGLTLTGAPPSIVVAGSNNGFGPYRAYSVDNPAAPQFEVMPGSGRSDYMHDAASMILMDNRKDTQCVNATSYCELLFDFNEENFFIWDITNTKDPVLLSNTSYPNVAYVHSGWWSEDGQFLFVHDELDEQYNGLNTTLRVFDLSNLNAPASAGIWTGPTAAIDHNGFVRGNRYYMSNYSRGLTILDITNVTNMQTVGRLDTFPGSDGTAYVGAWGVYPFFHSGNIAISDIDTGFYLAKDRTLDVAEGRLALSARSYGAAEGEQLQVTVGRHGGTSGSVSVAYEVLGASADGADLTGGSGVLNWGDGDGADKQITLDLVADGDGTEGLERLFIKLVAPTGGATLDPANIASIYVAEAGAASSVEFADTEVHIAERGFATAVAVLHRGGSAAGAASVDWSITSGDATAGTDFQGSTSGTVSWTDGDADPKWIEFAISDDGAMEGQEFFELTLANPSGAVIGAKASLRVNIMNGTGQNSAPNANAGASQTVRSGGRATLRGSASNDPDGDALTYQWVQTAGTAVTIDNATSATAAFTAPTVSSDQLLRFELTVSDGILQDTASTSVTVQRSGSDTKKSGGGSTGLFVLVLLLTGFARRYWASNSSVSCRASIPSK